ncbi:hypothetical protein HOE22_00130 [Candidatus Woesearchaeota archaeon]|jgi:hypothetical protein|nr:hypothetical protein [Candidatus Woesearchaeota archaeon]MBT4730505.1 hypothetical protein [Candidatus Woesearchaeota archaeon]MBT5760224.1 hypothetical protein [Candidatus Neomarinimicrobiota bacterium]MBT7555758.1 hypothetical protein [Candidatus Woesearchaeota archaeon]
MTKKRKISVQSGKAKGRKLQQTVRDLLLEAFKDELEPDDIRSTSMGAGGEDLQVSPLCRKLIPYSWEMKNQQSISIWSSLEQAEANCPDNVDPVLVFKRNRSKTYAVIELDKFIKLIHDKSK